MASGSRAGRALSSVSPGTGDREGINTARQAGAKPCGLSTPSQQTWAWFRVGFLERFLARADPLEVGARLGQRGPLARALLSGGPRAPTCSTVPPSGLLEAGVCRFSLSDICHS